MLVTRKFLFQVSLPSVFLREQKDFFTNEEANFEALWSQIRNNLKPEWVDVYESHILSFKRGFDINGLFYIVTHPGIGNLVKTKQRFTMAKPTVDATAFKNKDDAGIFIQCRKNAIDPDTVEYLPEGITMVTDKVGEKWRHDLNAPLALVRVI